MGVKPIPKGYRGVTPYLYVDRAVAAIAFYKRAFGGVELTRIGAPWDDTRVMHAELRICDSVVMLADEFPHPTNSRAPASLGGTTVTLHMYVKDVDSAFDRAVGAGATVAVPLQNTFWGDRFGKVLDPFGHEWTLASRIEDVSPQEISRRASAASGIRQV